MINKSHKREIGVLYIYWGDSREKEVQQSIKSVERLNYDHEIVQLDGQHDFREKARMYELSPFETTLFLDTDTILLDKVDFGFDMAYRHGMALSIAPACYARRFIENGGDMIEYNSGALFFKKNHVIQVVFEKWKEFAPLYPESDQSSLTMAIEELQFNPFVLPQNYNFRSIPNFTPVFGPLKIWHSRRNPPVNISKWNQKEKLCFGEIVNSKNTTIITPVKNRPVISIKSRILRLFNSFYG